MVSTDRGIVVKQLLLLVLLSLLVPSLIFAQEILFFDDFEDGMDDAWVMPEGGWEVIDGRLQLVVTESPLYAGGEQQSDYIISFDVFPHFGYWYYARVEIFLNDRPNDDFHSGYSFEFSKDFAGDFIIITRYDFENSTTLGQFYLSPFGGGFMHIKLGRIGSELVAKRWSNYETEPEWQVSFFDDSYHNGYWSPGLLGPECWIDNFQVEGYGTVSTEQSSWGGVKALYR